MEDDPVHRAAVISEDERYRYSLTRRWANGPALGWIMLNPSTADGLTDDATIRRCMGFARTLGYAGIEVANLYALRSTDPKALGLAYASEEDVIGPDNIRYIEYVTGASLSVVAAWGTTSTGLPRDFHSGMIEVVTEAVGSKGLLALDTTKSGQPRHPLYLKGDLVPVRWTP